MVGKVRLRPFGPGEYRPEGWLRRQLEIQAEGLSGNLDRFWPDIKDSAWIGGDRDGWERVPYWLDGFIPLAFLLDNADMKKRAARYVDAIISGQKSDGWLCPCEDKDRAGYDIWAAFLIAKVLTVWADCTGDERVPDVLTAMFSQMRHHICRYPLFGWARWRWYECLIPIYWLREKTGTEAFDGLAHQLKAQGYDYRALYEGFEESLFARGPAETGMENHVVNTAMAIKSGAVYGLFSQDAGNAGLADMMLEKLDRHHGTVTGIFTGDEHLHGRDPIRGTELCAVCELMYSLEWLIAVTGDVKYADRLEKLTFNALPAAFTPDMWAHQYDQQVNQVMCRRISEETKPFVTNNGESHIFGLEPNFGCCTANLSQAWPKFALSSFMHDETGITAVSLVPGKVSFRGITVTADTEYPFKNRVSYRIEASEPADVPFYIRIPVWAEYAEVNGIRAEAGSVFFCGSRWKGVSVIELSFSPKTEFIPREHGMTAISRGALIYSIRVGHELKMREYGEGDVRVYPHCDYEVLPTTPYAYKLVSRDVTFREQDIGEYPFDDRNPPVTAKAAAVPIVWRTENGVLALSPESLEAVGERTEIELVPYGTTMLRVTEFPVEG